MTKMYDKHGPSCAENLRSRFILQRRLGNGRVLLLPKTQKRVLLLLSDVSDICVSVSVIRQVNCPEAEGHSLLLRLLSILIAFSALFVFKLQCVF